MKRSRASFLAAACGLLITASAHADPQHDAANYVNSVHHSVLLDRLRTSFDRWDNLALEYESAREMVSEFHIYGAQYDLNYGTTADNGKRIVPQTFGLAMGLPNVRFYFLGHHTDIGNRSGYGYGRITAGANLNMKALSLQGEASIGTGKPSFFVKAFSPYVKTFVGAGFSSFELGEAVPGAPPTPTESGALELDSIEGATSILSVVNVGARYYKLLEALSPNLTTSYSDYLEFEDWKELEWDAELVLESTQTSFEDVEDYTIRLNYYHMLGEPLVEDSEGEIVVRPALLFGFSYKHGSLLGEQLAAAGLPGVDEIEGPGGEFGAVLRVLGFTRHGFPEATYVKGVIFYNHASYTDTYPQQKGGIKLRVDY
jgi:hypothetical protein